MANAINRLDELRLQSSQPTSADDFSNSSTESNQTAGTQANLRNTVNNSMDDLDASDRAFEDAERAKETADEETSKAAKAEQAKFLILEGDQAIGKPNDKGGRGVINTPNEEKLLDKWLSGAGNPYTLSDQELNRAKDDPAVQSLSERIRQGDLAGGENGKPGKPAIEKVELSDGSQGYRSSVSFDKNKDLDGSIGKATVLFGSDGKLTGLRDTYNFSNPSISVDLINMAGSYAGAQGFRVQGGVIDKNPNWGTEPLEPDGLAAAGDLAKRGAALAGEKLSEAADAVGKQIEQISSPTSWNFKF